MHTLTVIHTLTCTQMHACPLSCTQTHVRKSMYAITVTHMHIKNTLTHASIHAFTVTDKLMDTNTHTSVDKVVPMHSYMHAYTNKLTNTIDTQIHIHSMHLHMHVAHTHKHSTHSQTYMLHIYMAI